MIRNKITADTRFAYLLRFAAICLSFFCGVLLGFLYFRGARSICTALIRRSMFASVSFPGLLNAFLPLLMAVVLYGIYSCRLVFCLACIAEGCLYSLAIISCYCAVDRGAWLISVCLLFTSHISAVLTCVFGFRCFAGRAVIAPKLCAYACMIAGISVLLQYYCLQPYLFSVISF